jgi:chorismate mutase/prephenate dehydratase
MNKKKRLERYRKDIDIIDNKLIKLLNKRGKLAELIGKNKYINNIKINQPEREKEIIERMKIKSKGLKNESIESIWREIFEACKIIQTLEVPEKEYQKSDF